MRIIFYYMFVAGLVCLTFAQDYQEVEEKPVSRLRSPRGPAIPNRAGGKQILKQTSTTTTTEAAPEQEYDDAAYDDEQPQEAATTTTEAPRKGIRGGVLRPFRSNTDLIEALKRRRAQSTANGSYSSTTSTTEPSARDREQSKATLRQAKALSGRKFSSSRNGYERATSSTEQSQQENDEPTQKSRYFGRGRRF